MSRLQRKTIAALFVIGCIASYCFAQNQNAVVKRNTYLRQGPSSSDKEIILLKSGDELEVLEPNATSSYYHVRTLDADEGYAYSKNITAQESPEHLSGDLASPSGTVADAISISWEKPDPKKAPFSGVDGNCPPGTAMTVIPTPSYSKTGATRQKMTGSSITM